MSGIEEIYPNNVCTNARFTFWSYFSLDPYEDLLDFVQTKHQVRIDSLTARRIKQIKVFKDKTERQNYRPSTCSCRLATAFNTLI